MERQIAWAAGKPNEIDFTRDRAMIAAQRGRMKEARELYQRAFDMAKESGREGAAAQTAYARAATEYHGRSCGSEDMGIAGAGASHNKEVYPAAFLAFNRDITSGAQGH
jgi:hypothetical protein